MPNSINSTCSPAQSPRYGITHLLRSQVVQTHQTVYTVNSLQAPPAPSHSAAFARRLSAFATDDNVMRLCLTKPESKTPFTQKDFAWKGIHILAVGTREQPVRLLENAAKSAVPHKVLVVLKIFITTKCDVQTIQRLSNTDENRITATQAAHCLAMQIVHLRTELREKMLRVEDAPDIFSQLKNWFTSLAASGLNLNLQDSMFNTSNYTLEKLSASYLDDEIFEILVNNNLAKSVQSFIVNAEAASKNTTTRALFLSTTLKFIGLDSALKSPFAPQRGAALARIVKLCLHCLKKEIDGASLTLFYFCYQYIFTNLLYHERLRLFQELLLESTEEPRFDYILQNALHLSVQISNPKAVQICLKMGASATARLTLCNKWSFESFGIDTRKGALHQVVRQDKIDIHKIRQIIDLLCEYGADPRMLASGPVTTTNPLLERTPLDVVAHAARKGNEELANMLAEYIAHPNETMRCRDEQCIKVLFETTERALGDLQFDHNGTFKNTIKTLVLQAGQAHVDHGFGAISEAAAMAFYNINLLNTFLRIVENNSNSLSSQQDERNKYSDLARNKLELIKFYLLKALHNLHASTNEKNEIDMKIAQRVGHLASLGELKKSKKVEFSYGALELFVAEKQLEPLKIYCESGVFFTSSALRRAFTLSLCSTHNSEKNHQAWTKITSPFTNLLIRRANTPAAALIILRCAIELNAEASCMAVIENIRKNDIPFWQVARPEDASLLHMAIGMGEAILQAFLSAIQDDALLKAWLEWGDEEGDTAFHNAAVNSTSAMHLLLKAAHRVNASINSTNIEGRSALMEALASGHVAVLEALWSRKNAMLLQPGMDASQLTTHVVEGFFQGDVKDLQRFAKLPKGNTVLREHLVGFVIHVIDHNRLELLEFFLHNYTQGVEENITQFRQVLHAAKKRGNTRPWALFQTYLPLQQSALDLACDADGADIAPEQKVRDLPMGRAVDPPSSGAEQAMTGSKEMFIGPVVQSPPVTFCFAWRDRILDLTATRTERMAVLDAFLQHCISLPKEGKAWNAIAVEEGYAIMTALYYRDRKGGAGRHVMAHLPTVSLSQLRERLVKERLSGSSRFGRGDSVDILLGLQQVKRKVRDYGDTTARRQCIEYANDNLGGEGYVMNARSGEVNFFRDSHRLAIIVETPLFGSKGVECVSIYPLPNTVQPASVNAPLAGPTTI